MAGAAEGRELSLARGEPAASPTSPAFKRLQAWGPPALALVLLALSLWAHIALWGPMAPFGRLLWAGVAIEALGLAWMLWAAWHLRAAGTSIRPSERPRRLVDDGPFRFGRNPMLLGMTVSMLGLALKFGAPTLVAAAAAFALIMHRVHIPREEAQLRAAFGGWYSDYAASVRRWL